MSLVDYLELADRLRREAARQKNDWVDTHYKPELLIEAAATIERLALMLEEYSYD